MATIYVPGLGATTSESRAVDKAVQEYDERLYLKFNEETQQWCIFIKMGPNVKDIPVFGFDKIPTPEFVIESLYKTDSLKHGEQILADINAHNDEIDKPYNEAADEANGEMADVFEWAYRKIGSEKVKYSKSYRPVNKGV